MTDNPAYYRDLIRRILNEEFEDEDLPAAPGPKDLIIQKFRRGSWPSDPLIKQIIDEAEGLIGKPTGLHLHLETGVTDLTQTVFSDGGKLDFKVDFYCRLFPNDYIDEVPKNYLPLYDEDGYETGIDTDPDNYSDDELEFQINEPDNRHAWNSWWTFVNTTLKKRFEDNLRHIYKMNSCTIDNIVHDGEDSYIIYCSDLAKWLAEHLEPLNYLLEDMDFKEIQDHIKGIRS
jgi:hypothetical protein